MSLPSSLPPPCMGTFLPLLISPMLILPQLLLAPLVVLPPLLLLLPPLQVRPLWHR